jgi:hypothetical protein
MNIDRRMDKTKISLETDEYTKINKEILRPFFVAASLRAMVHWVGSVPSTCIGVWPTPTPTTDSVPLCNPRYQKST